MTRAFWLLTLVLPLSALAKTYKHIRQAPRSVIADMKRVNSCTERIWPGFSWANHTLVTVRPKAHEQLAFNADNGEVFKVPSDKLAGSGADSSFSFFELDGRKYVSVHHAHDEFARGWHAIFQLAVHESFHHIAQKSWPHRSGPRGTELPILAEPRIYRAMIADNLSKAVLEKNSDFLRRAKYWFIKWQAEFPSESLATTDGYEGTARYVDHVGRALARHGCDASEEILREWSLAEFFKHHFSPSAYGGRLALNTEGYFVGGLASFILRWDHHQPGWEQRVNEGSTPLEILLADVEPLPETAPNQLETTFKANILAEQTAADQALKEIREVMSKADSVLLNLPGAFRNGSTSYGGFFNDTKSHIRFAVMVEKNVFALGSDQFESEPGVVSVSFREASPCSGWGYVFAVEANSVNKMDNGRYAITSSKINGQTAGVVRTDKNGRNWLCAGEKP